MLTQVADMQVHIGRIFSHGNWVNAWLCFFLLVFLSTALLLWIECRKLQGYRSAVYIVSILLLIGNFLIIVLVTELDDTIRASAGAAQLNAYASELSNPLADLWILAQGPDGVRA